MLIETEYPLETAREAFWLAYQASSPARGMGALQARDDASREEVFENVKNEGDYPGPSRSEDGEYYGDYVFGRMLKLRLEIEEGGVEVPESEPDRSYQSWATVYSSYEDLVRTAAQNVAEMDEGEIETVDRGLWDKIKNSVT